MRKLLLAALSCVAVSATGQAATTLFSATFDGNSVGDTGLVDGVTTTGVVRHDANVTYLGELTQGRTATFSVNTAGYTNLTLSFVLYAVRSLDGNGQNGTGADPFFIDDDSGRIFNYTFANYTGGNTQSYGGTNMPAGNYAPRTGASGNGDLGFGLGDFGDSTYAFTGLSVTPGAGGLLTLTFTANSGQDPGDEFYGLDNLVVSGDVPAAGGVPEPASWAMMLAGFGAIGGAMRRRKVAVSFG